MQRGDITTRLIDSKPLNLKGVNIGGGCSFVSGFGANELSHDFRLGIKHPGGRILVGPFKIIAKLARRMVHEIGVK